MYVNIHPSLLPDLRGIDPVIGAVLFGRDGGATCHVMDAGIDTGDIIAQVRIPWSDDLDVTTLYQLSFHAEQQAFSEALARGFQPLKPQLDVPGIMYYSRRPEDRILTFKEPNDVLLQKIKAFNNKAAGCEFTAHGRRYKVYSATRMKNSFLARIVSGFGEGVVAFCYESCIIFRKDGEVLRLQEIVPLDGQALQVGDRLFGE
jgi:methionyl-tRNA formyltransferase